MSQTIAIKAVEHALHYKTSLMFVFDYYIIRNSINI